MDSWVDGSTIYFQLNPNLFAGDDVLLSFKVSTLHGSPTITSVDLSNLGSSNSFITEGICTVSWVNNYCIGGATASFRSWRPLAPAVSTTFQRQTVPPGANLSSQPQNAYPTVKEDALAGKRGSSDDKTLSQR